ncbi:hypothetical protein [Levilactobacillus namurensis]|uniref:Small integral membrane protein n=1 Tax=Levilactobacillus namurensis TaxID=380393 RepID=A0AAW8W142_9LACO|nr:hypothetical protein [Levilactobacillus namurensis]MDT7013726.1 hypothetical protein [Levilactobacillus namurensis]
MNRGLIGLVVGMALGVIWVTLGFAASLGVASLGAIGWGIGRFVRLDFAALGRKIDDRLSRER